MGGRRNQRDRQKTRQGQTGLSKHVERYCAKCGRNTTWVAHAKTKDRRCMSCGSHHTGNWGATMFRWLKLLVSGYSPWSKCWMGFHRWSMPGGWCEWCGLCDRFFGGHGDCGRTCRHWEGPS